MALKNIYSINVDTKRRMTSVVPTFKQGDAATLIFRVYDDGVLLNLNNVNSEITFTLPNGETLLGNPELVNGELVYEFTGLEMIRPGKIITILSIMRNNTMVSVPPFSCFIFDSMRGEALSYIGILQDLIKETQDLGLNFGGLAESVAESLELAEDQLEELHQAIQTTLADINTWDGNEQQRVSRENTRVTNEQSRVSAETTRTQSENARANAENSRTQAETNRASTFSNRMQQANTTINEMNTFIENFETYDYSPSTTYDFPNLITYNGSTYMALKQVRGITPTNDKVNYRLIAQRGVDGLGSVSKVNGISPDLNGNVIIDVGDSEELNVHKNNTSPQKHINVVSSIPNDVSNMGILVKVDGSSSDVPAMTTVDEINDKLNSVAVTVKTTDSTNVIISKLTNADGNSVKFPTGEYVLNGANVPSKKITITKPIKISGDNAVVYLESGMQIELKSPDIEISGIDFRVRNHGTLVGAESIIVIRRNNIKLDRCKFSGTQFYYGILIEDNEFKNCDDVSITNCKFDSLGYGILKQYGQGCSAHRLVIEDCSLTNTLRGDAVELNIGEDVGYRINNNYIDGVFDGGIVNAGIGIGIAGGRYGGDPLEQTREGYVLNNIVKNTDRCAIHLEACNRFDIKGNKVTNEGKGTGIETYGCTDLVIDSNYVENFRRGILDDLGVYNSAYIVSTDNNFITNNNVSLCDKGIELGAAGEARTQYCISNTVKNCDEGIVVYAKAIIDMSENLVEDCEVPFLFEYEPAYKASLFPRKYRYIKFTNNKTKFSGLLADNLKNYANITAYDRMEFEGNNFVLGSFTRKPETFVEPNVPLYFVKGDAVLSVDNGEVVSETTAVTNGFRTTEPKNTDAFYYQAISGNDYIRIVYPTSPDVKFRLGQVIKLRGAGAGGSDLITMIKEFYITSSEYRVRITDIISTSVTQSTSFDVIERAQFVEKETTDLEPINNQLEAIRNQLDDISNEAVAETVIEVGAGKQFTTVTSAINSITDNSPTKRYKIKVSAGTYAERINLKAYVGVEGINRDSVIFEWHRPTTTPNADVTNHSMVELHADGSYIRNITVKGSNFRYMIHAEFSNNDNRSVEVDNCYVEHFGNDSSYSWQLPHAVGAGTGRSNTVMTYKHSTFIGAANGRGVLIHDNTNPTSPSTVYIEGCTIATKGGNVYEGLNLDNYASYSGTMAWYIHLNNNVIQTGVAVSGTVQRQRIFGGGNSMTRYYAGNDWVDSHAGIYARNTTGATIPRGTALRFSVDERSFEVFNGTSASNYSRFAGFTLRDIPNGEFGWAVNKGVVPVLFGGSVNYTDQVMINGSGAVVKYEVASVNDQRLPIGQLLQPSANTGEVRRVALVDSVKNAVVPTKVLLQGSNVVFYPWGGSPLNSPAFIGQFAIDTVSSGVYMAKGTTISDWVKLNT